MGLHKLPKDQPHQPEWITIFITHDLQEAYIIAGRLKADNIPSMINTVPGASALGITIGSLGEIKILIHSDDYDKAYDILFPDTSNQLEDNTDKVQYIWHDDGDGDEYYIDEEQDDDE
jgi:hypothetical protein